MKWRVFIYLFRFSCIIKEMYLTFYLYYILLQFSVSLLVVTLARCIFWPTSCGENPQKVLRKNYMERWTKSLVFLFIKGFLFSQLELLFTNVVPTPFLFFVLAVIGYDWICVGERTIIKWLIILDGINGMNWTVGKHLK